MASASIVPAIRKAISGSSPRPSGMSQRKKQNSSRASSSTAGTTASAISLHLEILLPSPPQLLWTAIITLVEKRRGDNAIGAEMPESLAQLAPGGQQPHCLCITDNGRPDDALALAALFVAVANGDLPAIADPQPG